MDTPSSSKFYNLARILITFFMKVFSYVIKVALFFLILQSCEKENEPVPFECSVDYIEFVDATTSRLQFYTTMEGLTENYLISLPYQTNSNRITVGDNMVYIDDFNTKENSASFNFYYGENLGFFCADLFDVLPQHQHDSFYANASRSIGSSKVGKWKITKKSRN